MFDNFNLQAMLMLPTFSCLLIVCTPRQLNFRLMGYCNVNLQKTALRRL